VFDNRKVTLKKGNYAATVLPLLQKRNLLCRGPAGSARQLEDAGKAKGADWRPLPFRQPSKRAQYQWKFTPARTRSPRNWVLEAEFTIAGPPAPGNVPLPVISKPLANVTLPKS
jgi:hypothetical protein